MCENNFLEYMCASIRFDPLKKTSILKLEFQYQTTLFLELLVHLISITNLFIVFINMTRVLILSFTEVSGLINQFEQFLEQIYINATCAKFHFFIIV